MEYLFTKTPLSFFVQDLWRDEAFSVIMAEQSVGEIIRTTVADFSPPLYYLVLHYWMLLFGNSEVAIRSLSLFLYTLTIFFIFEIMVLVFKIPFRRALLYFTFIIINPFLLYYAFEARMYMMVTFFITLSYFALWTKRKHVYIAAITLALYTHYFAIFILAVQMLPQILSYTRRFRHITSLMHRLPSVMSQLVMRNVTFLLPLLFFSPWLLYLLMNHDFSDSSFWIISPPLKDIFYLPFVLYTGYERVFGQYYHEAAGYTDFHAFLNWVLITILSVGIIVPFILNYLPSRTKRKGYDKKLPSEFQVLTTTLWAFFPPLIIFIISIIATPLYHPRYFIFSSVGLLLLLVLALEYINYYTSVLLKRMNTDTLLTQIITRDSLPLATNGLKLFAQFLIIIYLLSLTHNFNKLNIRYHSKRNITTMYREIATLKGPDDRIYLTSELDYHLAQYYIQRDDIYIFNKQYAEIPSFVGKILIPEYTVVTSLPVYPQKAFIVSYDEYEIVSAME